jgi:hypothetical protein
MRSGRGKVSALLRAIVFEMALAGNPSALMLIERPIIPTNPATAITRLAAESR